jgi:hypothetical protein
MAIVERVAIDTSKPFSGFCQTVVQYHVNEQGQETELGVLYNRPAIYWADYQKKNPSCILVSSEDFEEKYLKPYYLEIGSKPFVEITEEAYEAALNCMPPAKWGCEYGIESFYVPEAYTGNIYGFYVQLYKRYFSANRPINLDRSVVRSEIMQQFF